MTNLTQPTISQLLVLWYEVIGPLHHKDRDCHFAISRRFCCYRETTWALEHHGYLLNETDETFPTYDAAESRLRGILILGITSWMNCEDAELTTARREEILAQINTTL